MRDPRYAQPPQRKAGPRAARNTWLRLFVTFPDHPKWGLVAKAAAADRALVIATAVKLLTVAGKASQRGLITDFSPDEWALTVQAPVAAVERIYDELHRVGWIDQGFLVTWYEHNPEQEDATRYDRVKRFRQRKAQERIAQDQARISAPPPETAFHPFHSEQVTKNAEPSQRVTAAGETAFQPFRNAQTRSDKIKRPAEVSEECRPQRYEPGKARDWLWGANGAPGDGVELVRVRTNRSESFARDLIKALEQRVAGDCDLVARAVTAACDLDADPQNFVKIAEQQLESLRASASPQPALRLMTPVRGNAS